MGSERACAACGKPLTGRANQRFCDATCRQRGARGQVFQLPSEPVDVLSTVDETRAELEAAGRYSGHLAAAALRLADRIDRTTAAVGYAPLVKELRDVMTQALAGATKQASRVDELKAKRDAKRNAG